MKEHDHDHEHEHDHQHDRDLKVEGAAPERDDKANSPTPINLRDGAARDDTGFLIVRFKPETVVGGFKDLQSAAAEARLFHINRLFENLNLSAAPLITAVTPDQIRKLEIETANKRFASQHSLLSYWRIDTREAGQPLEEIEAALRRLPEVNLVYREKTVTDPVTPQDDIYSSLETFLDPEPVGIDARWVWTLPNGDGRDMHFIDLEQGWFLDHEDLPNPTLVFNDNHDGKYGFVGDHGTAVVGIVSGVDNDLGIVGIAPNVRSVRLVSHWNENTNTSNVTNAVIAAITGSPQPHVLLIEGQLGATNLPVETDDATFDAIGRAVASGVIVIEPGGNGNQNLDVWTDSLGKHRLNRNGMEFKDSGAILVGAGTSSVPHERSVWKNAGGSNFGSRIDCYAWGDGIVSSGYGELAGYGATSYTKQFGGTSGASAIIAGCAVLVQGLNFAKNQFLFGPETMREILSDPSTGTAQGTTTEGRIGVMPNLRAVVNKWKLA